ncbi:hypothetical protein BT96DRAFT_478140 [Gymnopus androsaceus JB14]|uniref:Uncharacterized protein n=1 Tax=Gymnopus androsaceus JB14 TaxID=1447944 RepID=A0A6A4GPG1_9AGAR|nr:hypothetical protein BT96DRAFT_478140 [Gymnopus androsaceus JB14]
MGAPIKQQRGRRITSGSDLVLINGPGARSAGGASMKNNSSAGRKSLRGRSASPVASTMS